MTHAGVLVRGDIDMLIEHSCRKCSTSSFLHCRRAMRKAPRRSAKGWQAARATCQCLPNVESPWSTNSYLEQLDCGWTLARCPAPDTGWQDSKVVLDRSRSYPSDASCTPCLLQPGSRLQSGGIRPGRYLFRQKRLGIDKRPFMILKSTMYHHLRDPLAARQTAQKMTPE